jgi:hypothetical protein
MLLCALAGCSTACPQKIKLWCEPNEVTHPEPDLGNVCCRAVIPGLQPLHAAAGQQGRVGLAAASECVRGRVQGHHDVQVAGDPVSGRQGTGRKWSAIDDVR